MIIRKRRGVPKITEVYGKAKIFRKAEGEALG